MLLAKTIVKSSAIAGVGLFAEEDIKEGEIVWKFTHDTCLTFTKEQFNELANSYHKTENQIIIYYLTYCYYQNNMDALIFCLDNGRFVNHSDKPNLSAPANMTKDQSWQYSAAIRDIKKGEELTENYNGYDTCNWLDEFYKLYGVAHYQLEEAISS